MNIEIEKQIASIIESAKATGTDAVEFIKKQSPDYFTQLIKWKVWEGWLGILQSVGWVVVSGLCFKYLVPLMWAWAKDGGGEKWLGFSLAMIPILGMTAGAVLQFWFSLSQIIQANICPKVIMVEEIRKMMSGQEED